MQNLTPNSNLTSPKREFDSLEPSKNSKIHVRNAEPANLAEACRIGNDEIPGGVASIPLVRDVITHNPDNAYMFYRNDRIVGFYAMLMLTPIGLEQLLLGEFNGSCPDPICLSTSNEPPAAIYKWAVVAPGLAAEGIKHVSHILRQPKYQKLNFFSRPNTETGVRINLNLGFKPIQCGTAGLYRYIRIVNRVSKMQQAA